MGSCQQNRMAREVQGNLNQKKQLVQSRGSNYSIKLLELELKNMIFKFKNTADVLKKSMAIAEKWTEAWKNKWKKNLWK